MTAMHRAFLLCARAWKVWIHCRNGRNRLIRGVVRRDTPAWLADRVPDSIQHKGLHRAAEIRVVRCALDVSCNSLKSKHLRAAVGLRTQQQASKICGARGDAL